MTLVRVFLNLNLKIKIAGVAELVPARHPPAIVCDFSQWRAGCFASGDGRRVRAKFSIIKEGILKYKILLPEWRNWYTRTT